MHHDTDAAPGRCRVEAELRFPGAWSAAEIAAGRLRATLHGRTSAAETDALLAAFGGDPGAGALAALDLGDTDFALWRRHADLALAADAVRRAEAEARLDTLALLRPMHRQATEHGVAWQALRVEATARSPAAAAAPAPALGRLFRPRGAAPAAGFAPHVAARISLALHGDWREIERALERDRAALDRTGRLAWCTPIFEERRRRRRAEDALPAGGADKLPPAGARLLSLLREIAACLAGGESGAAFTAARALAIFAQSQPDVTVLLMRDPRSVRSDDGFDADEPADIDFEMQKTLRALQHRDDLEGLRDLFLAEAPRMGLLRLIAHRIRTEAEWGGSPFHAAPFRRVFGSPAAALHHLERMAQDGLLPAPEAAPEPAPLAVPAIAPAAPGRALVPA